MGCIPPACWPYLPACTAQGVPALGGVLATGGLPGPRGVSAPVGDGVSPRLGRVPGPGGRCLLPGGCLVLGGPAPKEGGGIPACTEADPVFRQNSWYTLLKILPCPKLRLRVVIMDLNPKETSLSKLSWFCQFKFDSFLVLWTAVVASWKTGLSYIMIVNHEC